MDLASNQYNYRNTIALHVIIWAFFIVTSLVQFYESPFKINSDFFAQWITAIVLFYLNYTYLVPELLLQKRYFKYFLFTISIIAFFTSVRMIYFIQDFHEMASPRLIDAYGKEFFIKKMPMRRRPFFMSVAPSFFYFLILTISGIIKILSEYYNNQQNKLIAEAQRTTTELIYLRKQTNPHFLFNTLNSIYSLAHKKSDLVPDAIVTLSELMRYMLYETDNKTVSLEKEINYIKNYIDLQKLRLNNIENIYLNIHGETKNKFIEPLLLISFIENAFKYGTDYKGTAHVKIVINTDGNKLDFFVQNKVEKYVTDPDNSGIGNSNIENRLKLIYPDAHELYISDTADLYSVHLILKLDQIQNTIN